MGLAAAIGGSTTLIREAPEARPCNQHCLWHTNVDVESATGACQGLKPGSATKQSAGDSDGRANLNFMRPSAAQSGLPILGHSLVLVGRRVIAALSARPGEIIQVVYATELPGWILM